MLRLTLITCLIASQVSYSRTAYTFGATALQCTNQEASSPSPEANKLSQCDAALTAALVVVGAQDLQITHLKGQVSDLTKQLANSPLPSVLPTWASIVLGALAGAAIITIIKH